jgi:hypothetical protein
MFNERILETFMTENLTFNPSCSQMFALSLSPSFVFSFTVKEQYNVLF